MDVLWCLLIGGAFVLDSWKVCGGIMEVLWCDFGGFAVELLKFFGGVIKSLWWNYGSSVMEIWSFVVGF